SPTCARCSPTGSRRARGWRCRRCSSAVRRCASPATRRAVPCAPARTAPSSRQGTNGSSPTSCSCPASASAPTAGDWDTEAATTTARWRGSPPSWWGWPTTSPRCRACGPSRTTSRSISSSRRNVWSSALRRARADGQAGVELLDERGQVAWRERLAEVIALHPVAAQRAQRGDGALVLHAFGEGAKVEGVREIDQRANDLRIAAVGHQVAHEALVDLQFVERELAQVGEGGVARAEVVDRELAAEGLEA